MVKSNLIELSISMILTCRECQQLLDQCMAQQRSFEAQLELNRIKQERRLKTDHSYRKTPSCVLITCAPHSVAAD